MSKNCEKDETFIAVWNFAWESRLLRNFKKRQDLKKENRGIYRVAHKTKPNFGWAEVARKKKPNFDVNGYPGKEKGATGRHGGSGRKKKPKNQRVNKIPKPARKKNQNPF